MEQEFKMEFEVDFYRLVGGGLREHVATKYVAANSESGALKVIRQLKKSIASECKYKTTGDTITYKYNRVV